MPDKYVNNTIDLEMFLSMNVMGELYTGFVKKSGYAYVVNIPPLQTSGIDSFHIPFKAQALDQSKEARVRSLQLTDEDLKRKIISCENGVYFITLAGGRVEIKSPDDVYVHIYDGGINLLVDLNVKKTSNLLDRKILHDFSTTIKLIDAPVYFSTNLEGYTPEDYIEGVDRTLSTIGMPVGFLSETWGIDKTKWTNNNRAQKYAYELSKSLKNNKIDIQTRQLKGDIIPKTIKQINRGLKAGGLILTMADIYCSHQIKVSHAVSLYMLVGAFPVSWVLGGVILSADILLECTTDKGLGDWIDYYSGKIGIGDENGVLFGGDRKFLPNPRNNDQLIFEPDNLRVIRPQIFDKYELY